MEGYLEGEYDVSKDGRFLTPVELEHRSASPLTVLANWMAGLKK